MGLIHFAEHMRPIASPAMLTLAIVACPPNFAKADEGGVSMWVPGFFGSLAATPLQPGWSLATIYYHSAVDASAAVARSRLITIGQFNPIIDITLQARLAARPDLLLVAPSYTFATPVLGGQANVTLLQGFGHIAPSIDALLTASIGPFSISRFLQVNDERWGFSDFGAQGSLRWNFGVHNFMTYAAVNVPTGTYDSTRLANFGIGHWAVDAGGGYTYFNPHTGNEFSAVLGFTYNFENPSTDYKNGTDMHLDLGVSKFLTKQLQIGAVGYAYQQITCDSGAGNRVGCFESRVFGLGPQIGYLFPLGEHYQGYLNLKGYKEFEAENRAEGWNCGSHSPSRRRRRTNRRRREHRWSASDTVAESRTQNGIVVKIDRGTRSRPSLCRSSSKPDTNSEHWPPTQGPRAVIPIYRPSYLPFCSFREMDHAGRRADDR